MQEHQINPDFQLAVSEFREFAEDRISPMQMGFDGKRFTTQTVQLVFEAFQAGRAPVDARQLFAGIRETSKYHHQIEWNVQQGYGHPFPVVFQAARDGHVIRGGVGGNYRLEDVRLYVMHDGDLFEVA